jgi:hypothetical protein
MGFQLQKHLSPVIKLSDNSHSSIYSELYLNCITQYPKRRIEFLLGLLKRSDLHNQDIKSWIESFLNYFSEPDSAATPPKRILKSPLSLFITKFETRSENSPAAKQRITFDKTDLSSVLLYAVDRLRFSCYVSQTLANLPFTMYDELYSVVQFISR